MEPKTDNAGTLDSPPEDHQIIRYKISQKMAFPVGYEVIRQHFAASIPWQETRLWFKDRPTTWASEFAEILRDQKPYRIFSIDRCSKGYRSFLHGPHWEFSIYPVARELKNAARSNLLSEAFPKLIHFVTHSPTHDLYYNRCEAIFDPVAKSCALEQLHPI